MPDYSEQLARARNKTKKAVQKKPGEKKSEPVSEISAIEFLLIGSVAITNDVLDYLGVDFFLFRLGDLITSMILGLWCLIRLHKFPSARFGGSFLIELIPILGDFSPTWTIFIISIYMKESPSRREISEYRD